MASLPPLIARHSWRNHAALIVATILGVLLLILLSPVFLAVWLCSLVDRARLSSAARNSSKPLHEAVPR